MSKKKVMLTIIILSVFNILLSFFVFTSEGAKEISINSRNKKTIKIENVTSEKLYKMEFVASKNLMNKIRIGCKIPEKQNSQGNLCYKLMEKDSGEIVAGGKHAISNIMIRGEFNITFENQKKSEGKSYVLEITFEDVSENLKCIMWANQVIEDGDFFKVDLISAASYATKTKPLLWDSLLIFAVVTFLSAVITFKEEKGK